MLLRGGPGRPRRRPPRRSRQSVVTSDGFDEGRAGAARVRIVRSARVSLAHLGRGLVDLDVGQFHPDQVVVGCRRVVGWRLAPGKVASRHRVEDAALLGYARDLPAVAKGDDTLVVGRVAGGGLGCDESHKLSDGYGDGPAVAQQTQSGVA